MAGTIQSEVIHYGKRRKMLRGKKNRKRGEKQEEKGGVEGRT